MAKRVTIKAGEKPNELRIEVGSGVTPQDKSIIAAIQRAVDVLYTKHAAEINKLLDESEKGKINVGFAVELDKAEGEQNMDIGISYSKRVKDSLCCALPDPGQVEFDFISGKDAKLIAASKRADQRELSGEGAD